MTISIVDEADDEVRRLAEAVPAVAKRSIRVSWDGRTEAGGRAPEGVYHVRVGLRRGGRAATLRLGPAARHDRAAPERVRRRPGRQRVDHGAGRRARCRSASASSRSATRRACACCAPRPGEPQEVSAFELPPGEREGEWDGKAGASPAPPGIYLLVADVRDVSGNVGRLGAGGRPAGHDPRPARVSVRGLIARPPADPVRAGEIVPFAVDSRGRPYRWRIFRVGEAKPRRKGRKPSGGELKLRAPRDSSGLYVLNVRTAKRSTSVPFAVQDATAGADPRRAAGDHLVRARHARRRPRRAPQHARERQLRRVSAAARRRPAVRLRRPRRAAARVPRPPAGQLRHHDRPHARRLARRAHGRARGRAARRAAALDLGRGRAAAAPLRHRRRPRRVVRRRLDAARRRGRARPAPAPAAARRHRPVRHVLPPAARARVRRGRCSRSRTTPRSAC